jgi:hypothetical protein
MKGWVAPLFNHGRPFSILNCSRGLSFCHIRANTAAGSGWLQESSSATCLADAVASNVRPRWCSQRIRSTSHARLSQRRERIHTTDGGDQRSSEAIGYGGRSRVVSRSLDGGGSCRGASAWSRRVDTDRSEDSRPMQSCSSDGAGSALYSHMRDKKERPYPRAESDRRMMLSRAPPRLRPCKEPAEAQKGKDIGAPRAVQRRVLIATAPLWRRAEWLSIAALRLPSDDKYSFIGPVG